MLDFKPTMQQVRLRLGLRLRPRWIKGRGPSSKRRGGKEREREGREWEGREGMEKGRKGKQKNGRGRGREFGIHNF